MSSEEWREVERLLCIYHGIVNLEIDGYKVSIMCIPTKNHLKWELGVFINGKFPVALASEDCDIRRRFFSKHIYSTLNAKDRKSLKKFSKKDREYIEKNSKYEVYYPTWSSFRRMKSHFIKNNSQIELLYKSGRTDE